VFIPTRHSLLFLALVLFPCLSYAVPCGLLALNPTTGNLDCVGNPVVLSSTTLPPGSAQYIQSTLTPTTTTQQFYVAFATADVINASSVTIGGGLLVYNPNIPNQQFFMAYPTGDIIRLVNTTGQRIYMSFVSSNSSTAWRLGNDVNNSGIPAFQLYNFATNKKPIDVSTNDVTTMITTIASSATVGTFGMNFTPAITSTAIYIVPTSTDATSYSFVVRDPLSASTDRIEMKSFGRLTINQTQNNPIPDNDLGGTSSIINIQQNGTTRFAVYASGSLFIGNKLDMINATPPTGLQYGNSQIFFNDGSGNIQLRTADGAATSILREGNPSASAVTEVFSVRENISGTPAAGYGLSIPVKLKSSITSDQYASEIQTSWSDATDATRKARLTIGVHDFNTSALSPRKNIQLDTDGTNPFNTFTGSTTVVGVVTHKYSLVVTTQTAGTPSFHVAISTNGHLLYNGPSPSFGACGTSPTFSGTATDNSGTINVGSGVTTSCVMNFANSWGVTPTCNVSDNSIAVNSQVTAISATSVTFSFSASLGSGQTFYQCSATGPSAQ
jgi:hypothetical protein